MSDSDPKDCLYHVWAFVRLAPGVSTLTEICLACGAHRTVWESQDLPEGAARLLRENLWQLYGEE